MGTWQRESFCGSCGWPLKYPPVAEVPPEIRGYPDVPRGRSMKPAAVGNTVEGLRLLARHHPVLFGTGTIVLGAGAIMLAPTLLALGHGVMVTGLVVAALGLVAAFAGGDREAGSTVLGGIAIWAAGAGVSLVGSMLAVAGVLAILAGSGVAAKSVLEEVLRWRIEQQLNQKNVSELVDLSRRLSN
jgi:hypothetical protein